MKRKSINQKTYSNYFTTHNCIVHRYSFPLLLMLAFLLPVWNLFSQIERKIVSVEKFNKLKVCKDYRVILVADQQASLTVEGSKKDIEKLKISIKNGELKLSRKGLFGSTRKVYIYVGVDSLSSIKAINNSIVESSGTVHASQNLKLIASNDARMLIQTDAKKVLTDSGFYSEILVKLIGNKIRTNTEYDPKSRIISQLFVAENK